MEQACKMDELTEKKQRLDAFLERQDLDALFLSQVANFAWLTGGMEPVVMINSDRAEAGLLVSREKRYVICNSIEYPRLRDEDRLEDQGYEFHVSPWYQRSEEHTSELQSPTNLVCRLL